MSFDVTQLPADLQAYIQAAIEKAVKANEPAPPREKTVEEKLADSLTNLNAAIHGERSLPTGSDKIHQFVYMALGYLKDYVDEHTHVENAADNAGNGGN